MSSNDKDMESLPSILRLPTEIRLMIFEPLLAVSTCIVVAELYESPVGGRQTIIRSRKPSGLHEAGGQGLISTCKTISQEALEILYRINTFDPSRHFKIYGCSPADRYCYKCQNWYRQGQKPGDKINGCLSESQPASYALEATYHFFKSIGQNASGIRRLDFNRFWLEMEEAFRDNLLPNVIVVSTPSIRYRHNKGESCKALLEEGDFKAQRRGDWSHLYRTMLRVILLFERILTSHDKLCRVAMTDPILRSRIGSSARFRLLSADEDLLDRVSLLNSSPGGHSLQSSKEVILDQQKTLSNIRQWHWEHGETESQTLREIICD